MKKKFIFLFAVIFCFYGYGQDVDRQWASEINAVFEHLDKSKVPHGILLDYAMEFTDVTAYDGILTNDNLLHRGHYTAIYNTLLMARVRPDIEGLIAPDIFKSNWDTLRQPHKIVLSGLYYKYSIFQPEAPTHSITITDGKLYDRYVDDVWQNPYEEKEVFAVSAPILKYDNLTMKVEFPETLWYTNQDDEVQNIAIDFNDGQGYQDIRFGQEETITYAEAGVYKWIYRLTLNDNRVLYAHSIIQIDGIIALNSVGRTIHEPCMLNAWNIDMVEFTGVRTYLNKTNEAILEIKYAENDCIIRKPLIVAEGFDSGLIGVENPLGENFYQSFRFNSLPHGGFNLLNEINTYDIIYVNWKKGSDYMQRNAYLLQDIIKWVNSVKQGNGTNVVLGQSMGGVIARYALRDMENQLANTDNQTWNHQTSLYISHDAPHQGANIPLSVLSFARHMTDQFVGTPLEDMNINATGDGAIVTISDLSNLLNQPGTKQLLMNRIKSGPVGLFYIDNNFAENWRLELRNMGYPRQTRNIAISNGNHCAESQDIVPLENLFSFSGNFKTTILTDMMIFALPIVPIYAAVAFNEPGLLVGLLPGQSRFEMDFYGKALPAPGGTNRIYQGKIKYHKKLFDLFGWTPTISVPITNRHFDTPPGLGLAYDYYPGGAYRSFIESGGSSSDNNLLLELFLSYNIEIEAKDNFNFIPTPSALDVGKGNIILNNGDYFVKYNAQNPPAYPKDISFDNFATSHNTTGVNETHISFNTRNGNWLAKELDSNPNNNAAYNCTDFCQKTQIEGNDIVCYLTPYSFSIPSGVYNNIVWSVSPANAGSVISGQGSLQATYSFNSPYNGYATINAILNYPDCGIKTINKQIWVGKPSNPVFTSGTADVLPGASIGYAVTAFGATSYEWKLPGNFQVVGGYTSTDEWQMLSSQLDSAAITPFAGAAGKNGLVEVRAINNCGVSNWVNMAVTVSGSGIGFTQEPFYNIYPNPTSDLINIGLADENHSPGSGSIIRGDLFDYQGFYQGDVQVINNTGVMDVSSLPSGIYILRISIDGNFEGHQVIIQ